METRYYLSNFVGDGKTPHTSFKPKVSLYGAKWSIIDFRSDTTQQGGWCFACLEAENVSDTRVDPDIIHLCDDPNVELPPEIRNQIGELLEVNFVSTNLADIITELLLLYRELRPNIEGTFKVWLGSLLKEISLVEAATIIGRFRIAQEQVENPTPRSTRPSLTEPLRNALEYIATVANDGQPGWLQKELDGIAKNSRKHPLAVNWRGAKQALAEGEKAIWASHSANWVMMLARDLNVLQKNLDMRHISARLRTPTDCEPTKYELYVMAQYRQAGARIKKTDDTRTGEFRASWDKNWVYVECKQKSKLSVRKPQVSEIYERGIREIHNLMVRRNVYAEIFITCRTDPNDQDLSNILDVIDQNLRAGIEGGKYYRKGKLEILMQPYIRNDNGEFVTRGPQVPAGFEIAVSEGGVSSDRMWCVAWRSLLPTDWIKSAIESFGQAADQLPKSASGLIYLEIPTGTDEQIMGLMAVLAKEIQLALASRKRVNAVVLTGQSLVRNEVKPNIAITRVRYQVIKQQIPRTPLPPSFKIFGSDFTGHGPTKVKRFLDTKVSLAGTKFKQETLEAAKKFLLEVIGVHDPRWLNKPEGPLSSYWNRPDVYAAAFMVNFADIFGVLQNNVTKRSVKLLILKLKALLRAKNEKSFNETLLDLQFARALCERVSPISFEPVLPDFWSLLGGRATGPDYCLRLPDDDVGIDVAPFYIESSEIAQTWTDIFGDMITRVLDFAYGFQSPRLQVDHSDRLRSSLVNSLNRNRSRARLRGYLIALLLPDRSIRGNKIIELAETALWPIREYHWLTGLLAFAPSVGFLKTDAPHDLHYSFNPNTTIAPTDSLIGLFEKNARFHLRNGKYYSA